MIALIARYISFLHAVHRSIANALGHKLRRHTNHLSKLPTPQPLPRRLDRKLQSHCLGHGNQCREPRVSSRRQRTIKALALNAGSLGHFGNATSGLRNAAQRDQQHGGLFGVFQCDLEVFRSKLRVLA